MREQYTLSDETRAVLTDNVKAIAGEMDVSTTYIYSFLSNDMTDPFAKFLRLYTACVNAGVDVTPWMACLSAIKVGASLADIHESLEAKIKYDARTSADLLKALRDGVISEKELRTLRSDLQRERDILDEIDAQLLHCQKRKTAVITTHHKFAGVRQA